MALKSAFMWGALQTATRMVLSFISIKVTAVFLGPAGLALTGQLGNFISLIQGVIGNAIQTGVVKLTAQAEGDKIKLVPLWSTALKLSLCLSGLAALLVASLAVPLSGWLFKDTSYWPVVVLAAFFLPFTVISVVLTGILNGLKKINLLGSVAIISAACGALIFIPLSYLYGIKGGLVGTVISYSIVFIVVSIVIGRSKDISFKDFFGEWNPSVAKSLIAFYPMLLVHAIAEPLAPLLVRDAVVAAEGIAASGFWQATARLSDMYTLLLTTVLSMYLMPHLSSIKDERVFGRELGLTVLKVMGMTAIAAGSLFFLRDIVISIVFTPAFHPVRDLMPYQLLGDVLKMAGWPLRMALVVKLRSYWYMLIEVGVTAVQVSATYLLLPEMGLKAATMAYALAWGGTLIALFWAFKGYWYALRRKEI